MSVQALTTGLLFLTANAESKVARRWLQAAEPSCVFMRPGADFRYLSPPALGKITTQLNGGRVLPVGVRPTL